MPNPTAAQEGRHQHPPSSGQTQPAPRGLLGALARRMRRIKRERRGATALEFALIFGPFAALLLVSLQIPLIYFANQALDGAATSVGRQIMTGQVQQSGMTQSAFQQAVCNALSGLFSCAQVMVDVESSGAYSTLGTTPPTITYGSNGQPSNNWAFNPGGPDAIVIVRVMYNWPVVLSALIPGLSNQPGNTRLLIGTAVFKNEPFP